MARSSTTRIPKVGLPPKPSIVLSREEMHLALSSCRSGTVQGVYGSSAARLDDGVRLSLNRADVEGHLLVVVKVPESFTVETVE